MRLNCELQMDQALYVGWVIDEYSWRSSVSFCVLLIDVQLVPVVSRTSRMFHNEGELRRVCVLTVKQVQHFSSLMRHLTNPRHSGTFTEVKACTSTSVSTWMVEHQGRPGAVNLHGTVRLYNRYHAESNQTKLWLNYVTFRSVPLTTVGDIGQLPSANSEERDHSNTTCRVELCSRSKNYTT